MGVRTASGSRYLTVITVLGVACAVAVAQAGTLTSRDVGAVMGATPLSARTLATLRGRYVATDGVVYFGLELVSRWTQANGSGLTVGTNVNLGIQGDGRPALTVGSFAHETGGRGSPQGPSAGTITGNPIAGVDGIGQGIQTTGNDNVIKNTAVINLGAGATGTSGHTNGPRDISVATAGGEGQVAFNPSGVTIAIAVPGQGLIQQTLGTQGLGQSAQVLSSANTVLNQMSLNVGFGNAGGFSAAQLGAILGTLKGL